MTQTSNDNLQLGPVSLSSRLIVGTGKYESLEQPRECLLTSGANMVTVAIRRVNPPQPGEQSLWDVIPDDMHILPNTAGCYTVEECLRTARLARELLGEERGRLVKVEVIGDPKTLFPDVTATIAATEALVKEGFVCLEPWQRILGVMRWSSITLFFGVGGRRLCRSNKTSVSTYRHV